MPVCLCVDSIIAHYFNRKVTIKAFLFDIDGTLVRFNGAGRRSLRRALEETYGTCGRMDTIHFQGKTDPLIIHESLIPAGFSEHEINLKIDKLKTRYFDLLRDAVKQANAVLLPGVTELLDKARSTPGILTGLLTGNFREGAMIKLSYFNLTGYFQFGVFSDDTPIRNEMPFLAREKIQSITNQTIDFSDIVIIGDTEYDIECGKSSGSKTCAVGTGWTAKEVLLSKGPDHYFDDLSNTETIFSRLLQ